MGNRSATAVMVAVFALPLAAQVAEPSPDLAPLGIVEFEPAAWAKRSPGTAHVDVRGRLWWSDEATARLHVYDACGAPLFVAQLEPARAQRMPLWFQELPEGLRVGTSQRVATLDLEGGQRSTRAYSRRGRRHWLLLPEVHEDELRWELGHEALWFRVPKGAAREVAHAALGCTFGPTAMASDGSLVVCEQSSRSDPGAPSPRLLRFRADGEPETSLTLAHDARVLDLLASAERLTLLVDSGGRLCDFAPVVPELWQLAPDGTLRSSYRLPAALSARQLFQAPCGDELWVFCPLLARVVRFPCAPR